MRIGLASIVLCFCAASVPAAPPATRPAPVDVGSRVEMFVDAHLIASRHDAELRLAQPIKREVVLQLDRPWEGPVSAYFSVFQDEGKIRLYYRGGEEYTCYAESADGIHFVRPNLGLVEFNGSTANNILFKGPQSASFAPFRDANPAARADEKYKALSYRVFDATHGGMLASASPDGIHWHALSEKSVVPLGEYDSLNCVSWDPIDRVYRVFDRYWTGHGFKGVRAIESRTSADFLHWSGPTPNRYADGEPTEHFYTSATLRCPGGAGQTWLAFPKRFVPERKKIPTHPEPGVSDAVFMSSRDGVHWDRTFREAWVRPGPDQRNWTERSNMPAWGIIETPGEATTFSMYISEHYRWPTNRLRRLEVRKFGFASVHAGAGGGEVITRPLTFAGDTLVLNYATSAAGSVVVELLDASGKPIPGFTAADQQPLYGDELDRPIAWKGGSLAPLAGRPVRLRLILTDADVYAIQFRGAR
jgi:hypothetical protein